MPGILRYRLLRGIACSSRVLLIGASATLVSLAVKALAHDAGSEIPWWLIVIGMVGVGLLGFQAWAEYQHRTYDPTLAFRFDERFYSDEFKATRFTAAKVLKDNQGNLRRTDTELEDVEDMLDFFEDIGFYAQGDQITPEVAHHHFYHWIRGYYLAARDYIEAWQAQERTRWTHFKELFDVASEIEDKSRGKTILKGEEISAFLDQEIEACKPKEAPGPL
jgi:hypothetical protein